MPQCPCVHDKSRADYPGTEPKNEIRMAWPMKLLQQPLCSCKMIQGYANTNRDKPSLSVWDGMGRLCEYKRMDSALVISLTECNTGTTQKLSSGVATTIELQNRTATILNDYSE